MKKLLISSALAAVISSAAFANNYSATDTFNASIDFVTAISVSVTDLTINNAVGGDTVDNDLTVTVTKDADRSASCSLSSGTLTLASAGETDITLTAATTCTTLSIDGTLPTSAANGKTYAGTLTLTAAYDTTTHN